jgi:hypothetical protein
MPASLTGPRILNPLSATAATTATITGNSFQLQVADAYNFILDVGAATGTTPTLDVAFQHSPNNGVTWYTFAKFAQVTAAGQRSLVFTPQVSVNQAASEGAIITTGAAVALNAPVVYSNVRILATVGGTTPSFATINVWIVCQATAGSYLS